VPKPRILGADGAGVIAGTDERVVINPGIVENRKMHIVGETMDVQVNWSQLGPGAIVGIGLLLVVLGAVGLVRRHDDL